jgi:tetratricopeptide (TPR) repeat protein
VGQLKCIGEKYPDDQNVWFYSGMCEKNLGEYKAAIAHFSKMISDETSPFFEEALWHTALCYEEMNEKVTAAMLFKKIKEMDGYYSRQAAGKL